MENIKPIIDTPEQKTQHEMWKSAMDIAKEYETEEKEMKRQAVADYLAKQLEITKQRKKK